MPSVLNCLPDELSFIEQYRSRNCAPDRAKWLSSAFEDDVWRCNFGKSIVSIYFGITLGDGSRLTDPSNAELLGAIKRYLCALTHPSVVGVAILAANTGKTLLQRALHVLDHFFLNGSFISASQLAFRQLDKNDIHHFIATVSSSRSIKTNIYEPEQRIADFVRTLKVTPGEIAAAVRAEPEIFAVNAYQLPEGINEGQARIARVWLFMNGFYRPGAHEEPFKQKLVAQRLMEHLIGTQVLSNLKFDNMELEYLSFGPREQFVRELQAAPVMPGTDDERAGAEFVQSYLQTLSVMGIGIVTDRSLVSDDALGALEEKEVFKHLRLKAKGRFATLPFEVANVSLRRAVEFYLDYGQDLVKYYLVLAEKNWQDELLPDLPPSLLKLGITKFRNTEDQAESFFTQLRRGTSLYEMLQVLLGAILVLVNTLMARREAELRDLTSADVVKDGPYFLLAFTLGKANIGEVRERVLRPIPALGAQALAQLMRLSEQLRDLGYESSHALFQRFKLGKKADFIQYGTGTGDTGWLRLCLDRFCDYVQIPTDENGRRYYIRPHQLRRNFAMLFFWQGSFGGIEVLRYFLGHQKPSMTYRYVTESMKGDVLRRVKAKVAVELIKSESTATESLAELICQRYGITIEAVHVLPVEDVIAYVEDLLTSKEVEIEPEFINGPNGEQFKILYKVSALKISCGANND